MAKEDVNIKVSANVAEAVRMWQAMEEGPKGMSDELEKMGRKGKRANQDMSSSLDKVVGKWTKIGASLSAARTLLLSWVDANKQAKEESLGATRSIENQFSKYRVQASVGGATAESDKQAILRVAEDRGVGSDQALAVATQFISSGFDREQVIQGGALNEFLRFTNASNALRPGADPAELAKQTALFLSATGQDKTTEALRETMVAVQRLFQGTNLQASGLGRFAEEAGQITSQSHVNPNEALALYSALLDVAGEAKASTAFRSFITSMPQASTNSTKAKGLESLGISPAEVDFEGESATQVLELLASKAVEVGPGKSKQAFQQIFGAEGGLAADVFLKDGFVEELSRRVALTTDNRGFEAAVTLAESSEFSELRRAEVANENSKLNTGVIREQARDLRIEAELRGSGYSNYSIEYAPVLKDLIKNSPVGYDIYGEVPGPTKASEPPRVKVEVEIMNQNVSLPAKSRVLDLGK